MRALDAMLVVRGRVHHRRLASLDLFPKSIERGGASRPLVGARRATCSCTSRSTRSARHFHFGEETHEVSELVSVSALVGLLMHTFVDGVAVASGFA